MARSTLELLLDSIKDRDEEPPDQLPALPQRPPSRARLPSRKRTSALLLDPDSERHTHHQPLHVPDALSHNINGNVHPEADGFSPTFQNGHVNGNRFTQENALVTALEPQTLTQDPLSLNNKENRLIDDGVAGSALLPEKQVHGVGYLSLKKRRRVYHFHGLQQNSRVWFLNKENNWVLGIIQSVGDLDTRVVCLADSKLLEIPLERLLPVNPEFLDGTDDLVQLSYIHEPAVFHVLQHRYKLGEFCTRAGSSCIVFTPPEGDQRRIHSHTSELSPLSGPNLMAVDSKWSHVYTTIDNAHKSLTNDWKSQSIILGGECPAGKMESTQAVLKQLVLRGNNDELGKTLLMSNLILEAFGSATTAINTCASRCGKLVDAKFDKEGYICSAHIQMLLMEKSRVVCRADQEGSYCVFYQLCNGADLPIREKLKLREATHFNYLRGSTSVNGAHPDSDFQSLINAFHVLGFSEKIQYDIFSVLGAILWVGNITSAAIDNNEAVDNAANLLSCSNKDLLEALKGGGPDSEDVSVARDALACALYERLCDWLVAQINRALKPKSVLDFKSITIVDIPPFGFSKSDGFESLLVNYAQEHLLHFTQWHLLREGEEVAACGGLRSHLNNSPSDDEIIRFLEYELFPSLVNLEDHTSSLESESGFLCRTERLLAGSPCCKQSKSGIFTVTHAFGEATYNVGTFLQEARAFSYSSLQIVRSCMNDLMDIAATNENGYLVNDFFKNFSAQRPQFSTGQEQVLQMMQRLEDTEPHFIFCMAPSESKLSQTLEQGYVVRQLRTNKIIETVRLCRSGLLVSFPHVLFASRFGPLLGPDVKKVHSPLGVSVAVLRKLQVPSYMYQLGWMRIFLCSREVDRLEHARKQFWNNMIKIQKTFRGFRIRKQLEKQKAAVTHMQAFARGWLVRKGFSHHSEGKAEVENSIMQYSKLDIGHAKQAFGPSQISVEDGNSLVMEESFTTSSVDKDSLNGCPADLQYEEYPLKERGDVHGYVEPTQTIDAEQALKKKSEEITLLQQSVKEYERKWIACEAKMKSMEEMWQKQVTSLEQKLSAVKGSNTEESAYKTGDSDKGVVISTPPHYPSTRDTPESSNGDPDVVVAKNDLDPRRSALDHLSKELAHRTQVFNDDAKFLVEVKSGQIAANFKPDEELQKLSQRFEVWKKDFKGRLKETQGILKKLGKEYSSEKNKKRWWRRK